MSRWSKTRTRRSPTTHDDGPFAGVASSHRPASSRSPRGSTAGAQFPQRLAPDDDESSRSEASAGLLRDEALKVFQDEVAPTDGSPVQSARTSEPRSHTGLGLPRPRVSGVGFAVLSGLLGAVVVVDRGLLLPWLSVRLTA